jgi:hypothetical protein
LKDLIALLNNPAITGAQIPDKDPEPSEMKTTPTPIQDATPVVPAPKENLQRIFFTGRFKSGKDFLAAQAGYTTFGFAEPLYRLASYFFGVPVGANVGKDLPGCREFLQTIGQWGRGLIDDKHPLTAERAAITHAIRSFPEDLWPEMCVQWDEFGRNTNIWVDSLVGRVNAVLERDPTAKVAVTGVRFKNEYDRLTELGWVHFHVMVSPATWTARLADSKLTPQSPEANNVSEKMAAGLDANVIKQISAQRQGHTLHAVWSDERQPSPSVRLHSVKSFLDYVS